MSQINMLSSHRRKARHFGLQALYQWYVTGADHLRIEKEFRKDNDFSHTDTDFFQAILRGVVHDSEALDALFEPSLDRDLDDLDPIEHSLLRMGAYELRDRLDVPYKVVINEAVSLAKKFGASESHKYINGVLDKLSRDLRKIERVSDCK